VLFFIDLDRRMVYLAGVTADPVGPWVTQQARNLVAHLEGRGRPFRLLVRDRDAKFVGPFDEVITSVGARTIKTPFRAPKANAFAERFVLTARAECLDWVLVRSERHAERVLREFVDHYNQEKTPTSRHQPRTAGPLLGPASVRQW
jgi:putative transposase